MKQIKTIIGTLLISSSITHAQPAQLPTGSGNGTIPPSLSNSSFAWFRGGNFPAGSAGSNNIFGTMWNSPIYTKTDGIMRMQMNGTVSNVVNGGASLPKDGFIGIGTPAGFYNGSGGQGPFSLLHLNGVNGLGSPQSLGYRDWMRYGITSTHNQDLMYIGQRATGGNDVTDAVIGWADNFGSPGPVGPDNMTFNFLTGAGQSGNDDLVGTANFGREIMRLTAIGNVGIGPRFNNTWQPQSTLHQHRENSAESWMQITNQLSGGTANATNPTAIAASDGLRWGINGANTGYLYNQENQHLLFSTNHITSNPFGGTNERIRITHIGAPGTPNPGSVFPNDRTRVSISHDPANPVTSPLSLLHVGYNTQGATNDGWRPWMDVGMFVSQSSDNVFLGLKNESLTPLGDQLDAVLSWGDNQINSGLPPFNGPDNFRFIFTSSTTGSAGGTAPATGANGLEGMRLSPTTANGVFAGIGGDPSSNLYTTGVNPGNTAEINSWGVTTNPGGSSGLRFTNLNTTSPTIANPGAGVLAVDANGDVIYVPGGGLANANNGVSINAGVAQLGVPCTAPGGGPNTAAIFANALTVDRVVANRNQNFWFASLNNETGGVGVGGNPTGSPFCNVGNTFEVSANAKNPQYPIAGGASGMRFTKLISTSPTIPNGTNGVNSAKVLTVDGDGDVVLTDAASGNFGNTCGAPIAQTNLPTDWRVGMNNFSVNFVGTGNVNIGDIQNCLPGSTSPARLWVRNSFGAPSPNTGFRVDNNSIPGAYAGYFASGDLFCTGAVFGNSSSTFSDKNIKTNVNTITNSMAVISKLRAVSYKYDNTYAPQLTFDGNTNYGFIAQEVAAIVPELVKTTTVYSGYDSLGNAVGSDVPLKALNYDAIIPFAVGAIQEINSKQKEMQANLDKLNLSDAQVKTNVNSFNALATVKTLSPVKYNFTNANVPQLSFKPNTDYGFIAQQLETVYPELVDTIRVDATYDSLGVVVNPAKVLKTVNYKAMSALLVRSIQEQQLMIDSLRNAHLKQDSINNAVQQQLANLAALIDGCCHTNNRQSNSTINQQDIELSDKDAIVLNQNVPNPFAEQTTITYNVPTSVSKAQIIFYNSAGQIIQTVDVKTRGKGKVNVFASDLSSGLYHYTLVADGKVVDSKKMVRE